MHIFRYISLVFTSLALLCGCVKNVPEAPEPELSYSVPFTLSVQHEPDTRASFSGSAISAGNYVFAEGDKLYITGGFDNEQVAHINGVLEIASGATTGAAVFSGDLDIDTGYEPESNTVLYATLVGASQVAPNGSFFTITDNKVSGSPAYPSSISASTPLSELVEKYSHFTSTFTYDVHHISLTQQSVFLNFELKCYRSDLSLSGVSPTVQVDLKAGSVGTPVIQSVTDVPVGGNSIISTIEFTAVVPSGASLQDAQTWINNNGGIHCEPDFASDLVLSANHYYHVLRSDVEEFTVEAPSTGQGATVAFNYVPVQFRKYSNGAWTTWADYTSTVFLSAGDKVSFRGQNASYANTGGSTPLITVTNAVYVYGDIMSLICDENWDQQSTVSANAFKQAFKGCTNINIHPDKDLCLSAETLGTSCYEGMFYGCTSLTKSPVLPATTTTASCYKSMFEGCTSLTSAPALGATTLAANCYQAMFKGCTSLAAAPVLPALTLVTNCYRDMFNGCSSLRSVTCMATSGINTDYSTTTWLNGVPNTLADHGVFIYNSSVIAGTDWPRSYNGIPTYWLCRNGFVPEFPVNPPFDPEVDF